VREVGNLGKGQQLVATEALGRLPVVPVLAQAVECDVVVAD
jgi:hypothetical protein